jgi:hypothetical protein
LWLKYVQEGRVWRWLTVDLRGYHVLGWLVTIVGFVIAALVARAGWNRTADSALAAQRKRRELDDENARTVLKDAITEGIGTALVFIPEVLASLREGRWVLPQQLTHLDEGRRSYDRNKDNMVHWRNEKEKLRIQLWFREAAVLRAHLDQFAPPPPGEDKKVYSEMRTMYIEALTALNDQARALYEELDLPRAHQGDVGYEKWAKPRSV